MFSEETLNTIGKITLILSDIMSKERNLSEMSKIITSFEEDLTHNTLDICAWFSIFQDINNCNPFQNLVYKVKNFKKYSDIEIRICNIEHSLNNACVLIMSDDNVSYFLNTLKNNYPKLYDEVWLNFQNPKYNVPFAWNVEKGGKSNVY